MMEEIIGTVMLDRTAWKSLRSSNAYWDIRVNVLEADGTPRTFLCHKAILVAASPVLASLFETELGQDSVDLPSLVTPLAFDLLLDCVYGESLTFSLIESKFDVNNSSTLNVEPILTEVETAASVLQMVFFKDPSLCYSDDLGTNGIKVDEDSEETPTNSLMTLYNERKPPPDSDDSGFIPCLTDCEPVDLAQDEYLKDGTEKGQMFQKTKSKDTKIGKKKNKPRKRFWNNYDFTRYPNAQKITPVLGSGEKESSLLPFPVAVDASIENQEAPGIELLSESQLSQLFGEKHARKALWYRKHLGVAPTTCDKCGRVTKAGAVHNCRRLPEPPKPNEKHVCSTCGKVYNSRHGLDQHLRLIHTNPKVKQFTCLELGCGKEFKEKYDFIVHLFHQHRKNVGNHPLLHCPHEECSYVTIQKQMLKKHLPSHSTERPFECSICKQTFKYQRSLHRHSQDVHGTLKLACEDCQLTFVSQLKLRRHRKCVHGNMVKNWKCGYCDHRTLQKSNCKTHVNHVHKDMPVVVIDLKLQGSVLTGLQKEGDFDDMADMGDISPEPLAFGSQIGQMDSDQMESEQNLVMLKENCS